MANETSHGLTLINIQKPISDARGSAPAGTFQISQCCQHVSSVLSAAQDTPPVFGPKQIGAFRKGGVVQVLVKMLQSLDDIGLCGKVVGGFLAPFVLIWVVQVIFQFVLDHLLLVMVFLALIIYGKQEQQRRAREVQVVLRVERPRPSFSDLLTGNQNVVLGRLSEW